MLVTKDDLAARLPFVMNDDEEREAEGALTDLSFEAAAIGSAGWTTEENTPQAVKNLVLRAAARHMKNYEGYTVSRAGDETVQWAEQGEGAGSATFTSEERRMLRQMGGRGSFIGSVGVYAYGHPDRALRHVPGYVPTSSGAPFPMYDDDRRPW